jgi:hypothetical protein
MGRLAKWKFPNPRSKEVSGAPWRTTGVPRYLNVHGTRSCLKPFKQLFVL